MKTAHSGLQAPHTCQKPLCSLSPLLPQAPCGYWSGVHIELTCSVLPGKKVVVAMAFEPQLSDSKLGTSFFLTSNCCITYTRKSAHSVRDPL